MEEISLNGLSQERVAALRAQYGFNEVTHAQQTFFQHVLRKIFSPIILMIIVALALALLTARWEEAGIITVLLFINLIVDFAQERKARNALRALQEHVAMTAVALRDGVFREIPARELLPGDIIKVRLGEIVPADAICIDDTKTLVVDQSSITGESLPVTIRKGDPVFASAIVQKGIALVQVTAIGKATAIGESIQLVSVAQDEEESHFQQAIIRIGRFLIALSLVLIVIVCTILIVRGASFLTALDFSLVLAIASIPVALPTVLSVTMAIGAHALAKRNAIVSNFVAIEELAGIDILCVDKTGTLTKNELQIASPIVYNSFQESDVFTYALLASEQDNRGAIERALFAYADAHNYSTLVDDYTVERFTPFDPVRKRTEAIVRDSHGIVVHVTFGAPEKIIGLAHGDSQRGTVEKDVVAFARKGWRVILLAVQRGGAYVIAGAIPFLDPPREDSQSVITAIKKRGIGVKMITGDDRRIARYIARILKIGTSVLSVKTLNEVLQTARSDDDRKVIADSDVFAGVTPADKYHIVATLQANQHIVAMTGDGVNDAPALKKADVGIAVRHATPAAQSAADLILLDDGLSVIKRAITIARETFARMQSYATFRIAETIRVILFVFFAVAFFGDVPVTATMIVLLALLNDIPVIAIAYDNVVAHKKPIRWHFNETLFIATLLGIAGVISSITLFWLLGSVFGLTGAIIQTMMFLKLDVSGHSTLYLTRTGRRHFWAKPYPSLRFFLPAFSSRIIGTVIAYYGILMEPISLSMIMAIWLYSTVWFLFNDVVKVYGYRLWDRLHRT